MPLSLPSSTRLEPLPPNTYIDQLQQLLKQHTTDAEHPGWLRMCITVIVTLLFVILAVGHKRAHIWWWFGSRLSKQTDTTQESHELIMDPQASTSTYQHH